jgi:hypothetical protein
MDEDWEKYVSQIMFQYGTPKYEFKVTRRIAHCSRCHHRFFKKEVRLRIITPNTTILLCPTGGCAEWFFHLLLQFKGVV